MVSRVSLAIAVLALVSLVLTGVLSVPTASAAPQVVSRSVGFHASTDTCRAGQSPTALDGAIFEAKGKAIQYIEIQLACHASDAGAFQLGLSDSMTTDDHGLVPTTLYAGVTSFLRVAPNRFRIHSLVTVACASVSLRPGTIASSGLLAFTTFTSAACPSGHGQVALDSLFDTHQGRAKLTVRFGHLVRRLTLSSVNAQ